MEKVDTYQSLPLEKGRLYKSKTGGDFKIVKYNDQYDIDIEFYNGYATKVTSIMVRRGCIKNPYHPKIYGIGFLGEGNHVSTDRAYSVWKGILARCYSKRTRLNKAYEGCTISKEWMNYHYLAEWYEKQPNNDKMNYQIDKDLLVKDNKVYSKDACCLLPSKLNGLLSSLDYEKSKCIIKEGKTFRVLCCDEFGIRKTVGRFKDKLEAIKAYRIFKNRVIDSLLNLYRHELDEVIVDKILQRKYDVNLTQEEGLGVY